MDIITPRKRCTKCGEEYPATTEYFYACKTGRYGVAGQCKQCQIKRTREYQERSDIKSRFLAQQSEYRKRPESRAARNKRKRLYYKRPEVKARESARIKAYNSRPERRLKAKIARNLSSHARRRKMPKSGVTRADVELQFRSQKGRCWHCGKNVEYGKFHIDHLIPLSRGGKHEPRNIVISCPECNMHKHSKLTWEWNGRLF